MEVEGSGTAPRWAALVLGAIGHVAVLGRRNFELDDEAAVVPLGRGEALGDVGGAVLAAAHLVLPLAGAGVGEEVGLVGPGGGHDLA